MEQIPVPFLMMKSYVSKSELFFSINKDSFAICLSFYNKKSQLSQHIFSH